MSDGLSQPHSNFCYRHPNRQSCVLCQRLWAHDLRRMPDAGCRRVHCPECMRESRQNARAPGLRS
jgi:hypothetical protein